MAGSQVAEAFAKVVDPLGLNLEACRGRMASVADEMVVAGRQGFVQGESGNRPTRTLADGAALRLLRAKSNQEYRAGVEINQPAGDDADNSGMPIRVRKDQSWGTIKDMLVRHF